jgi:branched-chain amino acid transport system permease protein
MTSLGRHSAWPASVAAVLIGGAAILAPRVATDYLLAFAFQLFMMIALAQAWNLISGMTGYVSFGHAAFFGIGAYAGALLAEAGFPWWLAILKGALIALAVSLPLGLLTLRLRGPYFAIAMLGLNEVGRILATLWVALTGGGSGISLSAARLPSLVANYYAMLAIAALSVALAAAIHRSRLGLELRAIREDEAAAEMIGVNTTRDKLLAFMLSALIPGAVGASYVFYTSYINPPSAFSAALNIQMIVMVMFGGSGTVLGPLIGAAVVMVLRETLWAHFPQLHLAALGGLLWLVLFVLPGGLVSLLERRSLPRAGRSRIEQGEGPAARR